MKRCPHIPVPSPQAKWEGKKPAKRLKLEAAPEAGADGDAGEAEEVWHIDAGAMGAFVHGLEDEFYEVGVSRFGLGLGFGLEDAFYKVVVSPSPTLQHLNNPKAPTD